MFNSTNPQDFYKNFACDDDCRQYLFDLKWNSGYVCRKCGNNRSWKGRTNFHRRCTACGYDESCTAYTLFHKPKLPLLKAFGIVFQIISSKKGKSTVDLAREFGVNQPTAWLLKNKVQKAASIGISEQLNGPFIGSKFSLDSIIITHRGENLNGFQRVSIYLAQCGESETQKDFITSYCLLPNDDGVEMSRLIRGQFKEFKTSLILWNFKTWLTGIHHHCSFRHLVRYLDEFFFKYNFRREPGRLLHYILEASIQKSKPTSFQRALPI